MPPVPPERMETMGDHDDPTPLWLVGLIIFGIAGFGGPLLAVFLYLVIFR